MKESLQDLFEARQRLLVDLDAGSNGIEWCAAHTAIIDSVIELLARENESNFPEAPKLAVVATGGYGRSELAPFSDIDITVVPEEDDSPHLDEALRAFFRKLYQTLGTQFRFEIGYSYRLIADVPGLDATTRTSLLDARLIGGSPTVFSRLMNSFWQSMPVGEFILDKIVERSEAERKTHDTPLVIEPHLKEGAGGLRAFQASNWIRSAIGERSAPPSSQYEALLRVRNLLHKLAGRKQDQLTRARQGQIQETTGWLVDDLMESVTRSLLKGAEEYRTTLERIQEARFPLSEGVTCLRGEARVLSPADAGLASVGIAIATRLGLNISSLPASYQDEISGEAALFAVSKGEAVLRNLDRCGLLDVLLPELTACRTLMPDDGSHTYSVFEHTLRVIRHLDNLDSEPFLRDLRDSVSDLAPLYLAALMHDCGKLQSKLDGTDHSVAGEELVHHLGARWNLPSETVELAAWLVREHLTLSLTMRLRDLQDPATIHEFAHIVENSTRLNLLTLLTWADISSVSEGAFTPAQRSFMRDLVTKTLEVLEGEPIDLPDPNRMRQQLQRELKQRDLTDEELEPFLRSLPAHYLAKTPPEAVRLHFAYVSKAREGQVSIESQARPEIMATEITVCAPDSRGLLSDVLGVMYAYDLSVHDLRACTTETNPAIALDVFTVSFGGRPVPSGTWRELGSALRQVLEGQLAPDDLLRRKGKNPDRKQDVTSYRLLDGPPAILEIRAPRGRGMAYRLTKQLKSAGLEIVSARLGQWAGAGAAAFTLKPSANRAAFRSEVEALFAG